MIVFYSPELTMMIFEVKFSNFISYQKASLIQIIRRKYNTFTSKFCVTRPEYWHYWRLRPVYRLTMTDIRVSENTIPDRTDWFHLNFRIRVICNIGSQMDRRKWLAGNVTILRVDLFAEKHVVLHIYSVQNIKETKTVKNLYKCQIEYCPPHPGNLLGRYFEFFLQDV